jgi:hypothetical protein
VRGRFDACSRPIDSDGGIREIKMSGHYWNPRYMHAWSAVCDKSPCDETTPFNVYEIFRAEGIPQGTHWGYIKKMEEIGEDDAGDRLKRIGSAQWVWDFESTRHPERFK